MKRYKLPAFIVLAIFVCGLAVLWLFPETEANRGPAAVSPEKPDSPETARPAAVEKIPAETISDDDEKSGRAINREIVMARLKELFQDRIFHPRIQLQAVDKLLQYLKKLYPDTWQDQVFTYLSAAFPEFAEEIYDRYQKLAAFKQCIKDNYRLIVGMDAEARKNFLWEMRRRFFGDEAEVIWEMEIKKEQLADSLKAINREKNMPLGDKMNYYLAEIDAIFKDRAGAYKQSYRQTVMDQFLKVESVQKNLRQMSPKARRENLDRFRKKMGLDEAARKRWEKLDRVRDRRWEAGRDYMQARKKLLSESGGDDPEHKLDRLRKTYFGDRAKIIKQEEKAGVFRFERKRVYGKN